MRILALNPPFLAKYSRESRSPAVSKSGTLYYPMWLSYSVGYLEKNGHELLFIDAPANLLTMDDVLKRAVAFNPQMAILDTSTPSIYEDIRSVGILKDKIADLFTVLIGPHVSALPAESLELDAKTDAVAFGESDATLLELADLVESGYTDELLREVKGLAFRASNGKIIKNERRPYIENLDDIPFVSSVYKKHLDISPYFYGHSRHPIVVLVTGRGCPFHCTYCVVPQTLQGHKYRKRSVKNIVDEFCYIRDNFPDVKEIMIEDDTLTADKERCRELSRALIDAGATGIPWSANSRPDVDLETMRIMRKSGCRLFCVGFESGVQDILNNIKKATKIETIHKFCKDARKAGILLHGCFMVGNRGETKETLEKTLEYAMKLNPDTAQFYPIMVYPGTSDFDYFSGKGWVVSENYREWLTGDGLHSSVVSNPELSYEYLVSFCDRARRKFYFRPRYLFYKGWQTLRHPSEAKRNAMGFGTYWRFLIKSLFRLSNK